MKKTTTIKTLFKDRIQGKVRKPPMDEYIRSLPEFQKALRKHYGISEKTHDEACRLFGGG